MKMPGGDGYARLLRLVNDQKLHTVCQSAKCPNMGECWAAGTATLMILGDVCTRSCGFCHIATGRPPTLDLDEPRRVGEAVATMKLNHVVITSVNRDELPDGGAQIWAETIRAIRARAPGTNPDFCGTWVALQVVLDERPEILNHNIETVPRLYTRVRPQAKYHRSLRLLQIAKHQGLLSKTGMMLGLGETEHEIDRVLDDLVAIGCDIHTLGQNLQPTTNHLPVERWVHPDEFAAWKIRGESRGLRHVESGPVVRSSYLAEKKLAGVYGVVWSVACGRRLLSDATSYNRMESIDLCTRNEIFEGDCLEALGRLPDGCIDLIFTSPPYADQRKRTYGGVPVDRYVNWFMPIAQELYRVLKPSGSFVLNIKERVSGGERHPYVIELILEMRKRGWLWTEEYIWHKKNCHPGKWPNRFRDAWERLLHFTKSRKFTMHQDAVMVPMGDWKHARLRNLSATDRRRDNSRVKSGFGKKISNWLGREMAYPSNVLHLATECGNQSHNRVAVMVYPVIYGAW